MIWRRRRPDSRLLLHVGRHKTGSTSLQQALAATSLRPFGVLYPGTGRIEAQHAGFPAALLGLPRGSDDLFDAVEAERCLAPLFAALEAEVATAGPELFVLSSEVFCELAKQRPQACLWLLEQFSSRWPLQLLQVVRPLPDFFLSAFKHQLRDGTFAMRSPFSWYRHCRLKTQILDRFWLYSGQTLITQPYRPQDSSLQVFEAVADAVRLSGRNRRRLLAHLPRLRANAGYRNSALLVLYVCYLIRLRAWQVAPPARMSLPALLSLSAFEERLEAAGPAVLDALAESGLGDADLLSLCRDRDRQLVDDDDHSQNPMPTDSRQDRLSDWQFLRASELYQRLGTQLVMACSLLSLPHPEG